MQIGSSSATWQRTLCPARAQLRKTKHSASVTRPPAALGTVQRTSTESLLVDHAGKTEEITTSLANSSPVEPNSLYKVHTLYTSLISMLHKASIFLL